MLCWLCISKPLSSMSLGVEERKAEEFWEARGTKHLLRIIHQGNPFKKFLLNVLGWHWLIKLYVSGAQFYNTSSVYCIMCSPPQVKSLSITICSLLPSSTSPDPPFPLIITILLSVKRILMEYWWCSPGNVVEVRRQKWTFVEYLLCVDILNSE